MVKPQATDQSGNFSRKNPRRSNDTNVVKAINPLGKPRQSLRERLAGVNVDKI